MAEAQPNLTVQLGDTYLCRRKDGTYHDAEVVKFRMNKRARTEEFFVHYIGLPRQEAEWVDKTRLALSKPAKDDVENNGDPKLSENEEMSQDQSSEEEEPETKKVKIDTSVMVCKEEESTCLLCSELGKDPVVAECGHYFCRSCIDKVCANHDPTSCPKCKKVITEKKSITNLAVVDVPKAVGDADAAKCLDKIEAQPLVTCPEHEEKLNLYCIDDGVLACVICQDSMKHNDHKFLPAADAADLYRSELSSAMSPLEEALEKTNELTNQQSEKIQQLPNTMTEYQQHIKSEFESMYNLLKEQKEKLLERLHEQNKSLLEEMGTNAAKMEENREAIKEAFAIAKQKVDETKPMFFLNGNSLQPKNTLRNYFQKTMATSTSLVRLESLRCQELLNAVKLSSINIAEKELCRGTFKGPIQYIVWKKMKPVVPVTFRHAEWLVKTQLVQTKPVKDSNTEMEIPKWNEAKLEISPKPLKDTKAQPCVTCSEHDEKLNLYCNDDDALTCIICRDSLKHSGHKFLSVVDADAMYRAQLSAIVSPLEEAWKKSNELNMQQNQKIKELRSTVMDCWLHIMSEFGNLNAFLKEQKEKLLEQLKEQSHSLLKEMETNAAKLEENRDAIKENLTIANMKVDESRPVSFLDGINEFIEKCQEQQKSFMSSHNLITDKQLCRGTFRGPVQYIAWMQMKSLFPDLERELELVQQPMPPEEKTENRPATPPVLKNSDLERELELVQQPMPPEEKTENRPTTPPALKNSDIEHESEPIFQQTPTTEIKSEKGTKEIWIVGDSFLIAVNRRAQKGPMGLNLGLDKKTCTVLWFVSSKNILGLLTSQTSRNLRTPDIICFCLGNFLEYSNLASLRGDLCKVAAQFPETELMFSWPLPIPKGGSKDLEQWRKHINSTFDLFANRSGYHLVRHDNLEKRLLERYGAGDKSGLAEAEIDLLLTGLRDSLQNALFEDCESSSKKREELFFADMPGEMMQSNDSIKCLDQPLAKKEVVTVKGAIEIWIVGNDFMAAARQRAENGQLGANLNFEKQSCNVHWWPMINTWFNLFSKLRTMMSERRMPNIIFLHLGHDDVGQNALMTIVQVCLKKLSDFYPDIKCIISTLLPKPEWQEMPVEHWRKVFNFFLVKYAEKSGILLLRHDELEKTMMERHEAGDHTLLTDSETDQLLESIRETLEEAMLKNFKPLENPSPCYEDLPSVDFVDEPEKNECPAEKSPVAPAVTEQKHIWILGSSYIYRVFEHASHGAFANNLGFNEQKWVVHWMTYAVRRRFLLNQMLKWSSELGIPSIVYLHIGSNDLAFVPVKALIQDFKHDIDQLVRMFPKTQFIFSEILPRSEWSWSKGNPRHIFNMAVGAYAKNCGFEVVINRELTAMLINRFRAGCMFSSLNNVENELFLRTIRDVLQKVMQKGIKSSINNLKPEKQVLFTEDSLVPDSPQPETSWGSEGHPVDTEMTDYSECLQTETSRVTQVGSEDPPMDAPLLDASECPQPETSKVTPEKIEEPPVKSPVPDPMPECPQPETSKATPGKIEEPPVKSPVPDPMPDRKQIWIVGNSYVCRAVRQATNIYGNNFGFEEGKWSVQWIGRVAMRWESLLATMNNQRSMLGEPSVVFIHLGDNDLGCLSFDALTKVVEDDLSELTMQFPGTEFVFSTVLPKAEWLANSFEQCRQDLNSALVRYAEELGFHVAKHDDIEEQAIPRFKSGGGTTISDSEWGLFVKNIRDSLERIMLKIESRQKV